MIGDKDPHYIADKIKILEEKPNFIVKTVANANHSLDIEHFDTEKSISMLKAIINIIAGFIVDFSEKTSSEGIHSPISFEISSHKM